MFTLSDDFLARAVAQVMGRLWPKPAEAALPAIMDEAFALADGAWAARRSSLDYLRSAPAPACKAGCGWCCHQQVGVTVVEAVRIAQHLETLPPEEAEPLRAQVAELDKRSRGLSTAQRAASGLACAFLGVDGGCRIYSVRPLRCRGLYSLDAEFCASSYRDPAGMQAKLERGELKPVFLSLPEHIYDSALSGVLMAIKTARAAVVSLELTAAVSALLSQPRLKARWLSGGKPDKALELVAGPLKNQ